MPNNDPLFRLNNQGAASEPASPTVALFNLIISEIGERMISVLNEPDAAVRLPTAFLGQNPDDLTIDVYVTAVVAYVEKRMEAKIESHRLKATDGSFVIMLCAADERQEPKS